VPEHRWFTTRKDQADTPFRASAHRCGDATVVRFSGELDMVTERIAADALTTAADGAAILVVDLDGLSLCGSTGLKLLVECQQRAETEGFALRVVATSRRVLRPLQITGVDGLLTICRSVEEAISVMPRQSG
jgi:anti-sigma B factor antagonist